MRVAGGDASLRRCKWKEVSKVITIILALTVAAGVLFIRLAPTDVTRWHQPIGDVQTVDGEGWSARVVPATEGLFSDIHQTMLGLPRTQMIAGSVGEGRVTYITRSKVIGFPDFTTIEQDGDQIKLYGRLRFGRSDLGVNGKRLDKVLSELHVRAKYSDK